MPGDLVDTLREFYLKLLLIIMETLSYNEIGIIDVFRMWLPRCKTAHRSRRSARLLAVAVVLVRHEYRRAYAHDSNEDHDVEDNIRHREPINELSVFY